MATTQLIENDTESNTENTRDTMDTQNPASRTTQRGHLALIEWDALAAPASAGHLIPVRRASLDRLYDGGIALLMLASALAAIASFARL